jgi:hypothetical protein
LAPPWRAFPARSRAALTLVAAQVVELRKALQDRGLDTKARRCFAASARRRRFPGNWRPREATLTRALHGEQGLKSALVARLNEALAGEEARKAQNRARIAAIREAAARVAAERAPVTRSTHGVWLPTRTNIAEALRAALAEPTALAEGKRP